MEGKRAGEKDDAGARERRKKGAFWRNINPIYESLVEILTKELVEILLTASIHTKH